MSWWDRLLGRPPEPSGDDLDKRALKELRSAIQALRYRTDRIVAEYEAADRERTARRAKK